MLASCLAVFHYRYRGMLGSAITVPVVLPYSRYRTHGIIVKFPPFPRYLPRYYRVILYVRVTVYSYRCAVIAHALSDVIVSDVQLNSGSQPV